LTTQWRQLGSQWSVSSKLTWNELLPLAKTLGVKASTADRVSDLLIEGGVKTGRSSWLGRPGFLPQVIATNQSEVKIEAMESPSAELTISGQAPNWNLKSSKPITGSWRVTAAEAGQEIEKVVHFEADAPERWSFREQQSLDSEIDLEVSAETQEPDFRRPIPAGVGLFKGVSDPLEAVYAAPDRGWSEAKLVNMLEPALPRKHIVWDFLRSLAESGFLEPMLSRGWRARSWHLRAPTLFVLGPRASLVEGGVGAMAMRRLSDCAAALGGYARSLSDSKSRLAAPVIVVEGIEPKALSAELNWTLAARVFPRLISAPSCWPFERRSENGRLVTDSWSFERGLFLPHQHIVSGDVRLDRLVREHMDDRDVFRVSGSGPAFLTASRVTGIMEAYRRKGQELFRWENGSLVRLARGGHLPLSVARALRRRCLAAGGPIVSNDGTWTYNYPCDLQTARLLKGAFGPAIGVPIETKGDVDLISWSVAAKRGGSRASWYGVAANSGTRA
jgi:hypothetical protein